MLGYKTALILLVCLIGEISGNGNESSDGPSANVANPTPPGTLEVTLLMFSGERDPEWRITPSNSNYQKIQRLLESARKDGLSYGEEKIPIELGFKGFLVKTVSTASRKAELILGHDTFELQKLFLQAMPKDEVSQRIRDRFLKVIRQAGTHTKATKKMFGVGPAWEPESWSEPDVVKVNNCYNYATNVKSTNGVKAQPGKGSGNKLSKPYTKEDVRLAAESDGLMTVSKENEPAKGGFFKVPPYHKKFGEKRYFVALFVKSLPEEGTTYGYEYHWYRRDNDGYWSHKRGAKVPERVYDENNQRAKDPRDGKEFDKHLKFVCFMTVDPDTAYLKIA